MSELPNCWVRATLNDTGEYINGMAFKPSDWVNDGLPIIRIQNLTDAQKGLNRTTLAFYAQQRTSRLPFYMAGAFGRVACLVALAALVWGSAPSAGPKPHARAIAEGGKDNAAGHLDLKIRERRAAMWGYDCSCRSPSAPPGRLTQWRGSSETFSGYSGEIRKCVN